MPTVTVSPGVDLCYETIGAAEDPVVLLTMGLGGQLIAWPDEFCRMLADRGRFVVRYDNRDCGLSTKFAARPVDIGR